MKNIYEKKKIDVLDLKYIRYDLIYEMIKWQISYRRRSISHKKEKSEIRKSTKKIYKQKGTGRARHGSLKANQFRGGGVTFGPNKNKKYSIKINKRIKRMALYHSIALKYKTKSIFIYKEINKTIDKIKILNRKYSNLFKSKNRVIIVDQKISLDIKKYAKEIASIRKINVIDLIRSKIICFEKNTLIKILSKFI